MTVLFLLPVILSVLVLAAHFLRSGNFLAVLGLLALLPLLAHRRRWVAAVARGTLWLGAGVWVYAIAHFAGERIRLGQPWHRMALILGGVAIFTALASLVFSTRRLRAWYSTAGQTADAAAGDTAGSRSDEQRLVPAE